MTHYSSVFRNSCLRVPVDPLSKMPKTAYERKEKRGRAQSSIDSSSATCSVSAVDLDANKLKDFYQSIPNYNDINHLSTEEFYSTLKSLRDKKKNMFNEAIDHIDDCNGHDQPLYNLYDKDDVKTFTSNKNIKSEPRSTVRRQLSAERNEPVKIHDRSHLRRPAVGTCLKKSSQKSLVLGNNENNELKIKPASNKFKIDRPKRNHSACSITWNDANIDSKHMVDEKFEQFFEGNKYSSVLSKRHSINEDEYKTQSMPSSPLKMKHSLSPERQKITIPKPFKMTERDEDGRMVNELRSLRKSFSEDMLHLKCERERKKFKAKPVPIESRIPLYDKILEDQAMRRAITKINSEAELRAQMKPFSFTKREEKGLGGICDRVVHALPKSKKKKKFKARPVPKNLFSNYFYDRMKEDEFFRSMNKRIRAEELLRSANCPGNMAARERSRLSTPAAHSDLPIDPSPGVPSVSSSDRQRPGSPTKDRKKRNKCFRDDFVTTSPQPFKFNTADRAAKKMHDVARRMYEESKSTESTMNSPGCLASNDNNGPGARAYSALDLRASAAGRSNLAALLRAEAVRRRFELEAARRVVEQRRRVETKQRDRLLRSKPAWHLVKNNHEEDIAMRLQTRRDEERMRREEFLHEMELMYGRVQEQPMLFERYYAPRSVSAPIDCIEISPRKTSKKKNIRNKAFHFNSPSRSRKVSINETAEAYNGDVVEYLNRIDIDDKYSDLDGTDTSDRVKT